MSFTYKPKRRKRAKTHGFRNRMASAGGLGILRRRRAKKRTSISTSDR
jgi:large subunit ribosomal protein L34